MAHTQSPPDLTNVSVQDQCVLGMQSIQGNVASHSAYMKSEYLAGRQKRVKLALTSGVAALVSWGQLSNTQLAFQCLIGAAAFLVYEGVQLINQGISQNILDKREKKLIKAFQEFSETPSLGNKEAVDKRLDRLGSYMSYKHNEIDVANKAGAGILAAGSIGYGYYADNFAIGAVGSLIAVYSGSQLRGHQARSDANEDLINGFRENAANLKENVEEVFFTSPAFKP